MIGMLLSVLLSGAFGLYMAIIIVRCRSVHEYVVAVGRSAEYRALAEGIMVIAVRLLYGDEALRMALKQFGSSERGVAIPSDEYRQYRGHVVYQRIDDGALVVTVTLLEGHDKQLLHITRVVDQQLFGYTSNDYAVQVIEGTEER